MSIFLYFCAFFAACGFCETALLNYWAWIGRADVDPRLLMAPLFSVVIMVIPVIFGLRHLAPGPKYGALQRAAAEIVPACPKWALFGVILIFIYSVATCTFADPESHSLGPMVISPSSLLRASSVLMSAYAFIWVALLSTARALVLRRSQWIG